MLLLTLIAGRPPAALAASGPSFDCSKAASADEQAICANPYLARLDVLVARAYANFSPEFGDKRAIGKWLLQDRNACGADEACIAAVEVNALETYGGSAAWANSYAEGLIGAKADDLSTSLSHSIDQALPKRIGDCAMTHIAELGTRFGDPLDGADPNAGTAVTFTNHGGQVSYELEDSLYDAKVGDPVVHVSHIDPARLPEGRHAWPRLLRTRCPHRGRLVAAGLTAYVRRGIAPGDRASSLWRDDEDAAWRVLHQVHADGVVGQP